MLEYGRSDVKSKIMICRWFRLGREKCGRGGALDTWWFSPKLPLPSRQSSSSPRHSSSCSITAFISQLWKLGSSIRWISIASFFMTFVLWDQIFKLHSIFSLLSSYFDQFCIFRPSDAFFILCNILKRRSYAKVPLVGASSCDTYLTIDNWKLWE